jgi:hypothetical protein
MKKTIAILLLALALPALATGPTLPPAPWEGGCVTFDSNFPFIHFVDCPDPAPAPAPTPNPNPPSCQDCINQ